MPTLNCLNLTQTYEDLYCASKQIESCPSVGCMHYMRILNHDWLIRYTKKHLLVTWSTFRFRMTLKILHLKPSTNILAKWHFKKYWVAASCSNPETCKTDYLLCTLFHGLDHYFMIVEQKHAEKKQKTDLFALLGLFWMLWRTSVPSTVIC